jgi:hypothetical protein
MGAIAPPELLAIHTNMPGAVPPEISQALQPGGTLPDGLSAEEKSAFDQLDFFYKKGLGYALEMANRPQTLYGLADSPVGLAAWMIDHDWRSYALIARVFDGESEGLNTRRHPRQRHALLVDEHGRVFSASLLGKQVRLLRRQERHHSRCRERVS